MTELNLNSGLPTLTTCLSPTCLTTLPRSPFLPSSNTGKQRGLPVHTRETQTLRDHAPRLPAALGQPQTVMLTCGSSPLAAGS